VLLPIRAVSACGVYRWGAGGARAAPGAWLGRGARAAQQTQDHPALQRVPHTCQVHRTHGTPHGLFWYKYFFYKLKKKTDYFKNILCLLYDVQFIYLDKLMCFTVKSFNIMGTKFHGLTMMNMFIDTRIHGF